MIRRTTIEIDDELLERAKRALGSKTARAAVEEALRRAAEAAETDHASRRTRQLQFLERLETWPTSMFRPRSRCGGKRLGSRQERGGRVGR